MTATTDTTYNGWTNRATWAVNLHLTNSQGTSIALDEYIISTHGDGIADRADGLRELVYELYELNEYDNSDRGLFISDLITTALSDVNWREIVENHDDDHDYSDLADDEDES